MPTRHLNWLLFRATFFALPGVVCASALILGQDTAHSCQADTRRPGRFNVNDFGAKGDGAADDAPAIQSAINAATKNAGGGTVVFPKGTYLLNSAYPSRHPWAFHNLVIDSNVMLVGETGAKLLQGPKGRQPLPKGAETNI